MAGVLRNNIEKWLRKTLYYVFNHPKMRDFYTYEQEEKIIKRSVVALDFILAVSTLIVMIWFFQRMNGIIGFEKTVIIQITLLAFILRNFLEVNNAKKQNQ